MKLILLDIRLSGFSQPKASLVFVRGEYMGVAFAVLLFGACSDLSGEPMVVTEAGIRLQIARSRDVLDITLSSPSSGWVAFGLHAQSGLQGMKFFMARHSATRSELELHLARPPEHQSIAHEATLCYSRIEQGRLKVRFLAPVSVWPFTYSKSQKSKFHGMLAYSTSADFDHHSRQREHFQLTLD